MATLLPSLSSCSFPKQGGEKRLAERLLALADRETLIWYHPSIGGNDLQPDFVILHPAKGLLIIEEKSWRLNNIGSATPQHIRLETPGVEVTNPLQQARTYAEAIASLLKKDPTLVAPANSLHAGKLFFPYGYGVVFSNITRAGFERVGLGRAIEPSHVIAKDEMYESTDPQLFQERLWRLRHYSFGERLSEEQVDRIRGILYPEIRIERQLALGFEPTASPSSSEAEPDLLMRVMDLQQEQLARSLGEGHRVIHGVAGSGKTLILLLRAEYLAKSLDGPILMLCFNVALASKLRHAIARKRLSDRVEVKPFHQWCSQQLSRSGLAKPDSREFRGKAYADELVKRTQQGIERGTLPAGTFAAVLLDEAHDCAPEWLKLIAQQVDPASKSLLVLYDDAQNLYGQKRRRFSFSSVGIEARGRTSILRVNYRNTRQILELAYEFARTFMPSDETIDEDGPVLVLPESAGRSGPTPEIVKLPNLAEEASYLVKRLKGFAESGIDWSEMGVLYRSYDIGKWLQAQLTRAGLPVEWVNRDAHSRHYNPSESSIKLLTMHSSKGLEFPVVAILAVDRMPVRGEAESAEARLLYVAMTRAIDWLLLTHQRESEFTRQLYALEGRRVARV